MANENEDIQELENEIENQEQNYVDIITELRANTVAKDKYTKLEADYKNALKALANGETIKVEAPETPDIDELRVSLYTDEVQGLSDIEFIKKTLDLRDAIIAEGGVDPAVGSGNKYVPDDSDFASAERVADVLQQCLDYANGDNQVFINELQRRTIDVPTPGRNNGNNRGRKR